MASTDPKFNNSVFRKDHKQVLAANAHLARLHAVKLAYDSAGYEAGQVIARNSTSGLYQKYVDGAASGVGTAAAVLFEDKLESDFASSGDTQVSAGIIGGELAEDQCIGLDAAAKVDLMGKSFIDATGSTIFSF